MRLDNISYSEGIDVIFKASSESAGCLLAADLGKRVTKRYKRVSCEIERMGIRVFWINVVVFFQGEGVVIGISLGKADAVGCLRRGDDDFLDTQLTSCFDDVVCASDIGLEELRIWDKHVACIGCQYQTIFIIMLEQSVSTGEVDHNIRSSRNKSVSITRHVKMTSQSIEDLSRVREVCLECVGIC
jgi:hypothetical protein